MNLPLGLVDPLSAMTLGGVFGFVLQRGGLGDGCKLTGQLRLEDWTVFNVMFTAILVAAAGLWILDSVGYLPASSTYVPDTNFVLAAIGGALVGLGMSVGGYCPGTSVVAAASGRLDGIAFFAGLVFGTLAFAGVYDRIAGWMDVAAPSAIPTLPELLHVPQWAVILALAAVAATVHVFVARGAPRFQDRD